jgi:alpha-L-fucosidase
VKKEVEASQPKFTTHLEHPLSSVPGETEEQRNLRMHWFRNAKFGMFVHWGLFAVPGGYHRGQDVPGRNVPPFSEWLMFNAKIPVAEYRENAKKFNPVDFDARAFVTAAQSAGMKYIVITTKHHEGFAMFDSKASDWNIVAATPYKKDPLKALAEECRKEGIKLGFYYSQAQDWNNGGSIGLAGSDRPEDHEPWDPAQLRDMDDYIDQIAVPQLTELLTGYGPDTPAILWWDTPRLITSERAAKINSVVQKHRPGIIQNDRLGGGAHGDTKTPEQFVPPQGYPGRDWEACMTLNDTWGHKKNDENWKSSTELIHKLVDIASKGGNFLLNVGPDDKGRIPNGSLERLAEIGAWMKVNGGAIYGTTGTPFGEEFGEPIDGMDANGEKVMVSSLHEWRATKKDGRLFLIVLEWPKDGSLAIPVYGHKILSAKLLAAPAARLEVSQSNSRITVTGLPSSAPDPVASVIQLRCES